jgi:hypothetical protein
MLSSGKTISTQELSLYFGTSQEKQLQNCLRDEFVRRLCELVNETQTPFVCFLST